MRSCSLNHATHSDVVKGDYLHIPFEETNTKQTNQSLDRLWGDYSFEETKKLKEPHMEPSIPFEETKKTQKT